MRSQEVSCCSCSMLCIYAANLRITCPTSFRVEQDESLTVVVEVSRSLPINATATPEIGSSRIDEPNITWSVNGNDSGLLLAQNVSVTWNVSYVDSTCSGVIVQPSVLANCLAKSTASNCTTNVLQVSKLPSSLNCFYVFDLKYV